MTRLRKELPDTLFIPAVEVEADEGDFLVFTEDTDYLLSMKSFRGSVRNIRRNADTAVVWAHPCVSQREDLSLIRRRGSDAGGLDEKELNLVARHVDGLEFLNGTMLSLADCGLVRPLYFKNLQHLARRYNLARTGGSDAHEEEAWFKVWTEFADRVDCVRDFVRAVKERRTRPNYDRAYFQTDIDLKV